MELTEEGTDYLQAGSPEAQIWKGIPPEGVPVSDPLLVYKMFTSTPP